jgi:WD40 repeat protein
MRRLARAIVGTAAGRAAVIAVALAGLWAWWQWGPIVPRYAWRMTRDDADQWKLSPDGASFAMTGARFQRTAEGTKYLGLYGPVRVLDAATGRERWRVLDSDTPVRMQQFSSDGAWLLTLDERDGLRVWDAATGRPQATLTPPGGPGRLPQWLSLNWSPDGRRIAVAPGFDLPVWLWETATGQSIATLDGACYPLAFTPDGHTLATATPGTEVKLWDAATGRERASLPGHPHRVGALAISPDGRRLAAGLHVPFESPARREPTAVKLWDLETRSVLATIDVTEQPENAMFLDFSPTGRELVILSQDGRGLLWDVTAIPPVNLDALLAGTEHDHRGKRCLDSDSGLLFSPDGMWWAVLNRHAGAYQIVDAATRTPRSILRPGHTISRGVGPWFAPNGRTIAVDTDLELPHYGTGWGGWVNWARRRSIARVGWGGLDLFDPATGRRRLALPLRNQAYRVIGFTPDSRIVWTARFAPEPRPIKDWTTWVFEGWAVPTGRPPLWLLAATALGLLAVAADVRRSRRGRGA